MDSDAVSLPDIRRLLSDASSMRDLSRGLVDGKLRNKTPFLRLSELTKLADSIVVLPCSEKYLHILSVEISRAWAQPVAEEVNSIAADDAEQRTRFVLNEVGRLLDHPDLFPFNEARVRFLAMLTLDSELRFTVTYANLLIELELEDLEYITERDYSRKTYKEDCSGWENFLLNKAPGAPKDHTDRTETVPETSLQLLPPVAMRIVNDIVAEEKDILTFMEENNGQFDGTSTGSVVMADFETKTESTGAIPTFSLPQQTYDATVRPNPFRQVSQIAFHVDTSTDAPVDFWKCTRGHCATSRHRQHRYLHA